MKKRLVLCGCAASGKDYARKILTEQYGMKYEISYTSRPPRPDEIDNVDYYFMSREDFVHEIQNEFFYEYVEFNGWYYGTAKWQFEKGKLFIMTPAGISYIKPEDRPETLVVYFDIPESVRRSRLHMRNDTNDKIDRRIVADIGDFKDFKDFDIRITDPYFKPFWLVDVINTYQLNLIF